MPGNITALKATLGNSSVASVSTTDSKRFFVHGKKVGSTKYAVKYSLQGKEHSADVRIEVLAREVPLPIAVTVGDSKSFTSAEVGKIAGLEGKILSLGSPGDSKLCKVELEKGGIRVTGLKPGDTSATAVYGGKTKERKEERIKVQIKIAVANPRSG